MKDTETFCKKNAIGFFSCQTFPFHGLNTGIHYEYEVIFFIEMFMCYDFLQ